ncbi:unnamed protein product (mitochondrion) [Plasmodiophora brassicae]|uniref:Cyclic nucleotide-binding domain-containing protein n=1 Tax=Plasmodiophora brassicae TaxID=37360 RepID=A0A3P3YPA2_PLABS|nr:unnamed protein product [Plasmodiophora brassicae]
MASLTPEQYDVVCNAPGLLFYCPAALRARLASLMTVRSFGINDTIVEQSAPVTRLFVLIAGQVVMYRSGDTAEKKPAEAHKWSAVKKVLKRPKPAAGAPIGRAAGPSCLPSNDLFLTRGAVHDCSIVAVEECIVAVLESADYERETGQTQASIRVDAALRSAAVALGKQTRFKTWNNEMQQSALRALSSIPYIRDLPLAARASLCDHMSLLTIAKDETMPGADWIFVVLTGSLAECTASGECTQIVPPGTFLGNVVSTAEDLSLTGPRPDQRMIARQQTALACLRISTTMRELRRNGALPMLTDAVQQALKVPPRKRNDNACNVIIDAFPALFDQLDKRLAMRIASEVHLQHLPSLSVMMQQGAPADKAFVLASGTVAVHERRDSVSDASGSIGDLVCELSPGHLLGMEMINGGRFQSTVVTRTKCDVVVVERHSMRELLASAADLLRNIASLDRIMKLPRLERSNADLQALQNALHFVKFFADMVPDQRLKMMRLIEKGSMPSYTTVFKQGDEGDNFYLIVRGSVSIHVRDSAGPPQPKPSAIQALQIRRLQRAGGAGGKSTSADSDDDGDDESSPSGADALSVDDNIFMHNELISEIYGPCVSSVGPGSTFGELALLHGKARAATVVTRENTMFLTIKRKYFLRSLRKADTSGPAYIASFLKTVYEFQCCRTKELMKLARSACEIRHYMPEEYLCMQGQPASAIHVVVSGDVRLTRSVSLSSPDLCIPGVPSNDDTVDVDLAQVGPHQTFCAFQPSSDSPRRADLSATSITSARVLCIRYADYHAIMSSMCPRALSRLDEAGRARRKAHDQRIVDLLGPVRAGDPEAKTPATSQPAPAFLSRCARTWAPVTAPTFERESYAEAGRALLDHVNGQVGGGAVDWRLARDLSQLLLFRTPTQRRRRIRRDLLDAFGPDR